MNRPQVAYFLSGVLAYFPSGARTARQRGPAFRFRPRGGTADGSLERRVGSGAILQTDSCSDERDERPSTTLREGRVITPWPPEPLAPQTFHEVRWRLVGASGKSVQLLNRAGGGRLRNARRLQRRRHHRNAMGSRSTARARVQRETESEVARRSSVRRDRKSGVLRQGRPDMSARPPADGAPLRLGAPMAPTPYQCEIPPATEWPFRAETLFEKTAACGQKAREAQ